MELLTVVRQLSAEKDQERASTEQEINKGREAVEAEKNALYAERAKQQVWPCFSCCLDTLVQGPLRAWLLHWTDGASHCMQELFEQVVRQRDMYKKLLQDASGIHRPQQADGTRLLLPPPGASAPESNGNAQVQSGQHHLY